MNREIGEMSYGELAARAMEYSSWDTSDSLEKTASVVQALAKIVAELVRRQEAPKAEGDELDSLEKTASAVRALAEFVAELVQQLETSTNKAEGDE